MRDDAESSAFKSRRIMDGIVMSALFKPRPYAVANMLAGRSTNARGSNLMKT